MRIDFTIKQKTFFSKDSNIVFSDKDLIVLKKENPDDVISIYSKLLELNEIESIIYRVIINAINTISYHLINILTLSKECRNNNKNYSISTYKRHIYELINKHILIRDENCGYITVNEDYDISKVLNKGFVKGIFIILD